MRELKVMIAYDPDASLWVTWSSEVPGLTAIDETESGLVRQIEDVAPELLELSRESSRLPRDNVYDIVVLVKRPDLRDEQPRRSKSFNVALKA